MRTFANDLMRSIFYRNSNMAAVFQNPITINGNAYFASDFHLGVPNPDESRWRECQIVKWLDSIKNDCTHLFLLGDIFDYWFEYKDVVPRGYYLLLAQLHELQAKGIVIYYFTGNHDMWVQDYFTKEIGAHVFRQQQAFVINGKRCMVGHGDGLGPKDSGYKFIKAVFAFRPNQKLYGCLHPRHSFAIARFFSRKSRAMTSIEEEKYLGDDKEMLVQYCKGIVQNEQIDYFIYGHRHLIIEKDIEGKATYFNIGDWIRHFSYLTFKNNGEIRIEIWPTNN